MSHNEKIQYKEVKKPAMKFIGIGVETSVQNAPKDCPKVWAEFMKLYKEIKNYIGGMKNYGVAINPNEKECTFRYIAAAQVSKFEAIPEGMETVEVPKETCLVFIHKGKLDKLGETYWKIMQEIPKTRMKQKEEFWIEYYDQRWRGDQEESIMEIWIPVTSK